MQRFAKITRIYHTVKYLKFCQIYYRLYYRFKPLRINYKSPYVTCRSVKNNWQLPILKSQHYLQGKTLHFLNKNEIYVDTIWHNKDCDKLWLYNLHYFDYLNTKDCQQTNSALQYVMEWVRLNPPVKGVGWEPYPISLRVVNWIKYMLAGGELPSDAIDSLYLQVRALDKQVEFHILGNHLFENFKALCFAGLFFEGAEADRWFARGFKGLLKQANEQILEDGGHFELSPMYHSIILEGMLDLANIFTCFGKKIPNLWRDKIQKMRSWLMVMCHPDGNISFFNDATFGVAPTLATIEDYCDRLTLPVVNYPDKACVHLENSGYIRIKLDHLYCIIDVGHIGPDYLPGHAHADTLSYELSYQGQRVVVNSGINCYGVSDERLLQRSTKTHNTVEVNGMDSSHVWSGFRVAQRAYPYNIVINTLHDGYHVTCSHDGYAEPCSRSFIVSSSKITVEDNFEGNAKSYVHFHPNSQLKFSTKNYYSIEDSLWYPTFNYQQPNKKIVLQGQQQINYELLMELV